MRGVRPEQILNIKGMTFTDMSAHQAADTLGVTDSVVVVVLGVIARHVRQRGQVVTDAVRPHAWQALRFLPPRPPMQVGEQIWTLEPQALGAETLTLNL